MSYMMGARRGFGFDIKLNTSQIDALASGASAEPQDSGLPASFIAGKDLVGDYAGFFSEGLLSTITDSVQGIVQAASEQINTQGASDDELAQDATDDSRGRLGRAESRGSDAGSSVGKKRQGNSASDSVARLLAKASGKTSQVSKDLLDKRKDRRDSQDVPEKRRKVELQTKPSEDKEGVPVWVWVVAAGAVAFALYGRKR